MRKEFGKWILDITKYMVTALLLSTIFTDMGEPVIFCSVVIISLTTLVIGLLLVDEPKNEKKGK